ncbi:MAG: hypothetical protein KGH61_05045 [Candidatus Micrarchaeota archaeon]|nr:hypothetical protein [Candidatus Micrarchaeota archaeon]MDE1848281.1 hypothetical protein [Candidatus Micrarchaeota archaeon]MDE1864582.1 hypothetical protein [Candidatus Micrarchaeota archaeon]
MALTVVLSAAAYVTTKTKHLSILFIIIGVAVILLGTEFWLYGSYSNGALVWLGIIMIIAGNIVWLVGDSRGGALNEQIAQFLEPKKSQKNR